MPLHHPPGHAQVDFGEAVVEVGGRREKVAFFCLILPHSNLWFVKAYPRETTEAFLDGHVSAFAFLGGVPRSILYDNTTLPPNAAERSSRCSVPPMAWCFVRRALGESLSLVEALQKRRALARESFHGAGGLLGGGALCRRVLGDASRCLLGPPCCSAPNVDPTGSR